MLHFFRKIGLMVFLLSLALGVKAQKTPLEFNDYIASITDSLNTYGRGWGMEVKSAFESDNYSTLTERRIFLEKYIDKETAILRKMKDIKNSKALREAMIAFLNFEKTAIVAAMKPFEKMSKATTEEQKKSAIEQLTSSTANEEAELAKVSTEQAAYAKANNISLGAAEETE